MIGRLRGIPAEIGEDHLLIDVNGVGYLVFASSRLLSQMQGIEGEISLLIETHVREDHIHLYGFLSREERQWFRLLTSVQGVGAKMGLNLLGAFSADELANAVAAQDKAMLTRASGVGPRLGERIVTELKNKVAGMYAALPAAAISPAVPAGSTAKGAKGKTAQPPDDTHTHRQEAVSALVNLGYARIDAFSAVTKAADSGAKGLDDLIRHSLRLLTN